MTEQGYLGIDLGTQGLSALWVDEDMQVVASGKGDYGMFPGLEEGCCEQVPEDWWSALKIGLAGLKAELEARGIPFRPRAIGISGQMHGEVLTDQAGQPLGPARLWCDGRNEGEGEELTALLSVKMPKRITAARWLWTMRTQPVKAAATRHITTPGGWLAGRLTGQWLLGIGDASGMFPVSQQSLDYDQQRLELFDERVGKLAPRKLGELLPRIRSAGKDGGQVTEAAASELGLPAGTPVAPAEGDQPAALAGSLIAEPGTVGMSFGTSVCANSVGDRPFQGVHPGIDHFCAADGRPINLVLLRNGTAFLSVMVELFGQVLPRGSDPFSVIMPLLLRAEPDCGGLMALPFMDDEPGLGIARGGTALFAGLNAVNATPGNLARAALQAVLFNLRCGTDALGEQGLPLRQVVLTGGLARTPETGQLIADTFGVPVSVPAGSSEGSALGAAFLARYRFEVLSGSQLLWAEFVAGLARSPTVVFQPWEPVRDILAIRFRQHKKMLGSEPAIANALSPDG